MGRGGILFLGGLVVLLTWFVWRAYLPDKALGLTIASAWAPAYLAVQLFLECKCGEKKDESAPRPS
jgi:hypothetical protein